MFLFLFGGGLLLGRRSGLGFGWIVSRVDVNQLEWPGGVDLDYSFSFGHGVMIMVRPVLRPTIAAGKVVHRALVKLIAHANVELAGNHGHVFRGGMPVRHDAVSIRRLNANDERTRF